MSSKERLMQVLVAPHVSEKAARVAEQGNQVVFRVLRDATKPEIKAAVIIPPIDLAFLKFKSCV